LLNVVVLLEVVRAQIIDGEHGVRAVKHVACDVDVLRIDQVDRRRCSAVRDDLVAEDLNFDGPPEPEEATAVRPGHHPAVPGEGEGALAPRGRRGDVHRTNWLSTTLRNRRQVPGPTDLRDLTALPAGCDPEQTAWTGDIVLDPDVPDHLSGRIGLEIECRPPTIADVIVADGDVVGGDQRDTLPAIPLEAGLLNH